MAEHPQKYLWKMRLIATETTEEENIQKQIFEKNSSGVKERKLKIIHSPKVIFPRKKNFVLIGLDGTIKAESDHPFRVKEIFGLIDSMPMRKNELSR